MIWGYALTICPEPNLGRRSPSQEKPVPWVVAYKCSPDVQDNPPVCKLRRAKFDVVPRFCDAPATANSYVPAFDWLTLDWLGWTINCSGYLVDACLQLGWGRFLIWQISEASNNYTNCSYSVILQKRYSMKNMLFSNLTSCQLSSPTEMREE